MAGGEPGRRSATEQLERLDEELSRHRGMHVTLAPDSSGEAELWVVSDHPHGTGLSRRGMHIRWHDGSFWRSSWDELPGGGNIAAVASQVAAALAWSPLDPVLPRPPDDT